MRGRRYALGAVGEAGAGGAGRSVKGSEKGAYDGRMRRQRPLRNDDVGFTRPATPMARGAASSCPATIRPCGTPATVVGMRRRSTTVSGGGGFSGDDGNMLRFYTDEASGMRLSLTIVLVMSLCFIDFVTDLHVFNKLYSSHTAATSA
ncbi:protein transport protein Sec61 subunit beta-like [Phragmites australis]|uniref:protein transport protein Sec61 subunit beta-like n=1 Tax=Phragmites australis TaxID=29695 RepID=UPI002D79B6A2|nr:protein transport protein Sec61 subunit beta-like [Phragmites australis]